MNKVIEAHLTCDICGDTWFRSMTEKQLADYMAENPQANFRAEARHHMSVSPDDSHYRGAHASDDRDRVTSAVTDPSDGTHVDLQGVICDGCEDFYADQCEIAEDEETEAQYLDERKEDACAAAGTGEFAIWHFDPET